MGSLSQPFRRPQFDVLSDQHSVSPSTIRSIRDLIDHNALHNPEHIFCIQSKQSSEGKDGLGYVHVTFRELKEAVDRCCHWILETIPDARLAEVREDGSVQKSPPVALLMESDVNLFIYIAALLTLNIPVRLPRHISPLNVSMTTDYLQ